ncbi:hypothetical protein [Acididesulfobacillus acetoxydans]|uniref:hypothetical protein n=1 Tax=Acididesulfobacillus acetoxydans TaxID=1561005 RepID=UPI001F0DA9F4|nr:hypothetical protein [Acididesulfobacillus acetoxydans]
MKQIVEFKLEVGNDNGNSEHDLVINGATIQQPNVLAKICDLPMMDALDPGYVAQNIHKVFHWLLNSIESFCSSGINISLGFPFTGLPFFRPEPFTLPILPYNIPMGTPKSKIPKAMQWKSSGSSGNCSKRGIRIWNSRSSNGWRQQTTVQ